MFDQALELASWPGRTIGIALMIANWLWGKWGGRYRLAVPGSLEQEYCRLKRRKWRWPGFLFIPVCAPNWVSITLESFGHWYFFVWAFVMILIPFAMMADWHRFKRELEEDEDDWWNKAGRAGKRLARRIGSAAAGLVPKGSAAPSPA